MRYLSTLISTIAIFTLPVLAQADAAKPTPAQSEGAPAQAFVPPKVGKPENRVGGATRTYSRPKTEEEAKKQAPDQTEEPKKEAK